MSVITIFNGIFCREDLVVEEALDRIGCELVTDKDLAAEASKVFGMTQSKIERAFSAKTPAFNKFTHELERSVASLRFALAERLFGDNLLIFGFAGQLIPKEVSHVLRVCLIADTKFRISVAMKERDLSEKDAVKLIHKHDTDCAVWINTLYAKNDPWDASLYDTLIPMDKKSVKEAATFIHENVNKDILKPTEVSKKAVEEFLLAATVEVALAREGHIVGVSARDGSVTLTINKQILMLQRLEEDLKSIAGKVRGVTSVETAVGKDYHPPHIYRKHDFEKPSRVLLVDDERDFVQALSERLLMRQMGSAVAYDGESALNLVNEEEAEVMILDLKMPGIDGIEVLRRVKETGRDIEVIILTGHGSEADKEICMKLGAFAYLQKPVDIDLLSDTLKRANEKLRRKKSENN
jgi:CheY-like chemotaxis protein